MGNSAPGWDLQGRPGGRGGPRTRLVAGAFVVTLLAVGAVVFLRGDDEDPAEAARAEVGEFLAAWAAGDLRAAARHTDDAEAAVSLLESVDTNMAPQELTLEVSGQPSPSPANGGDAGEHGPLSVPFTAAFTLEGIGEWSYDSAALAVPPGSGGDGGDESWTVRWESPLVHPELQEGQTLVRTVDEPGRAPILASDGSALASVSPVRDISIWPGMLTDPDEAYGVIEDLGAGIDTGDLADRVAQAQPDQAVPVVTLREEDYEEHAEALQAVDGLQFREGTLPLAHSAQALIGGLDPGSGEGSSGLQARYQEQLAGTPAAAVVIADRESGEAVETLHADEQPEEGTPVRTTIDPAVQEAAEAALSAAGQGGAIVAVQPSTGHILAVADRPEDGPNFALSGQYPPGSTFKIVTTAALLEGGTAADDVLGCPRYAHVDGQPFHNQDEFGLGPGTTLHEAFTASCNTAYIGNQDRFGDATLQETAEAFGIGGVWDAGAVTFDGSVPVAESPTDRAASLIGQGRVQAGPLVMASVAATVADGGFRQPVLVPDAVTERYAAPARLSAGTYEALRAMMRDTVQSGTATVLGDVPGAPHAKTGTAEFNGEDGEISTHAWINGYLGERDLAFAVLLRDGGSGGSTAGPVAADFLGAL